MENAHVQRQRAQEQSVPMLQFGELEEEIQRLDAIVRELAGPLAEIDHRLADRREERDGAAEIAFENGRSEKSDRSIALLDEEISQLDRESAALHSQFDPLKRELDEHLENRTRLLRLTSLSNPQ